MNVIKFELFNCNSTEWFTELVIDGIKISYVNLEVLIRKLLLDAKIGEHKIEITEDDFKHAGLVSFNVSESENFVIWENFNCKNTMCDFDTLIFDKAQYYKELVHAKRVMYNLINGSDQNEYVNKFFCMEYKAIYCGWLAIAFGKNENVFYYSFDESLSDPFPGLVRMYHKIKMGEDYQFKEHENGTIAISVEMLKCDNDSAEELIFRVIYEGDSIEERMSREDCLAMLESLFSDLLYDDDYPWQYPCFSCIDDAEYSVAWDKEIEAIEKAEKKPDYDEHYSSYLSTKFVREMVTVHEAYHGFLDKFTTMLKELKVPSGWKS